MAPRPSIPSHAGLVHGSLVIVLAACSGGSGSGTPPLQQQPEVADLRVSVRFAPDLPAPPGVRVTLSQPGQDDIVGETDVNGQLLRTLALGPWDVVAVDPGLATGTVTVDVLATPPEQSVTVMAAPLPAARDVQMAAAEIAASILPRDFASFTLTMQDGGAPVTVASLGKVELLSGAAGATKDITNLFEVSAGELRAPDVNALRTELFAQSDREGSIALRVRAVDTDGRGADGRLGFMVAMHRLEGSLTFPAGLQPASVSVRATLLEFGVERTATATGPSMAFDMGVVPPGTWFIEVAHQEPSGTDIFTAFETVSVTADTQYTVTPRSTAEWFALGGTASVRLETTALGQRVVAAKRKTLARGTADVQVRLGARRRGGQPAARVDDTWEFAVFAVPTGAALVGPLGFDAGLQRLAFPVWQSDGATGLLTSTLDISALTTTGPVDLVLVVGATNWGDPNQRVRIDAQIGPVLGGGITLAEVDGGVSASIPTLGRFGPPQSVRVLFDNVAPVRIQNVQVDVIDGDPAGTGDFLGTVVNEGIGDRVKIVPGIPALNIEVGFADTPSPLVALPPPTDGIRYRVVVEYLDEQSITRFAAKETGPRVALYEPPSGLRRFRSEDPALISERGDWVIPTTRAWIESRQAQFRAWGDFTATNGLASGALYPSDPDRVVVSLASNEAPDGRFDSPLRNLAWMRQLATTALKQPSESRLRIANWIRAERQWMTDAETDASVEGIVVGRGPGSTAIRDGWVADLLLDGVLRAPDGTEVDLGLGAWVNSKVRIDAGRSHVGFHAIQLTR